jgi:hypothetical protein
LVLGLALVVETAVCPAPDAALPVLGHLEFVCIAG